MCVVVFYLQVGMKRSDARLPVIDFRAKFKAIHREYSPEARTFYGHFTNVTVCRRPGPFLCPCHCSITDPLSFLSLSIGTE